MTNTLYPANAVSGAPSYNGRALRQTAVAPFVDGATAARPLGARGGVRRGTSTTTVSATSTTWTVNPHAGVIDAEAANEAGPYVYSFDAVQTGPMTAADSTNPRIDVIYVRIDDPAEGDGTSTPGAFVGYQAGTPATTPSAPTSWTGSARSMVIAQINVPKAGSGSPSVTWTAPYLTGPGGIIPVRSQAERDAITYASTERPVYADRLDTGNIERNVGSGWVVIAGTTLKHAEFTTVGNGVPDATIVGAGTVAVDATASTDTTFAIGANTSGQVTLASAGIYAVHWAVNIGAGATGRYFLAVLSGATEIGRAPGNGGAETNISLALPNLRTTAANTVLTFQAYKTTGGLSNITGRIRVTRIG